MNTEDNLCEKIKEICINQLTKAIEGNGHYKAKYVKEKDSSEKIKKYNSTKEYARSHIETLLLPDEYENYDDIFRRLLISGQNRHMMPRVIGFMQRKDCFEQALWGLKYVEIAKEYQIANEHTEKELLLRLKNYISEINNDSIENSRSLWRVYAKFIIKAALFMQKYPGKEVFFTHKLPKNFALHNDIMQGISGIGFTLACDFLKEIGFDTAKPDLHILAFLNEMYTQQLEAKKNNLRCILPKNIPLEEAAAVETMNDLAVQNQCSVYALDKLIWLCCSGNYYSKGDFPGITVESKSLRDLFLEKI